VLFWLAALFQLRIIGQGEIAGENFPVLGLAHLKGAGAVTCSVDRRHPDFAGGFGRAGGRLGLPRGFADGFFAAKGPQCLDGHHGAVQRGEVFAGGLRRFWTGGADAVIGHQSVMTKEPAGGPKGQLTSPW